MSGLMDRLSKSLGSRSVKPPLPKWCKTAFPDIEPIVPPPSRDGSSSWCGFIRYVDAKNEVSARRIACRAIEGYGSADAVLAWCFERRAHRRFRIDRITELVSLDSGEVLDPAQHFEELRLHGALKVVDKALNDFGRLLVFLARCDGEVHPLEVESIEFSLNRYVLRFGGDDRTLESAIRNSGRIAPDSEDFVGALTRMWQHPNASGVGRLLMDCMNDVADADGVLHSSELNWLNELRDALIELASRDD